MNPYMIGAAAFLSGGRAHYFHVLVYANSEMEAASLLRAANPHVLLNIIEATPCVAPFVRYAPVPAFIREVGDG